jgi:hypothetical protein
MYEKLYLRREDPTEDEVNVLIELGYTLVSVSPMTREFIKAGIYKSLETVLVYHFLLKGAKK